jgi:membrane protease YdiL (CAAX protease family)
MSFLNELSYENNNKKLLFAGILLVINVLYALLLFLVIYPNVNLSIIQESTFNIITVQFIVYIPLNILNILFFIILTKMTIEELGFRKENWWKGLLLVVFIWLFLQVILLLVNIIAGIRPIFSDYWSSGSFYPALFGNFVGEFLGNSLFEEVLYRAVLFPQLYLFLKKQEWIKNDILNGILAALISQMFFAVMHLPNRIIAYGLSGLNLFLNILLLFGIGSLFVVVYFTTESLAAAIFVHALNNIGLTIFTPFEGYAFVYIGIMFIGCILYHLTTLVISKKDDPKKGGPHLRTNKESIVETDTSENIR